jgi:hypothetical protein
MFYHLDPAPSGGSAGRLVERIFIPVLDMQAASSSVIESVTVVTIALGFLWVLLKLRSAFWSKSSGNQVPGPKKTQ